jgi:phenylacetate-CoA ligase
MILEILRDEHPVAPGESGEVIVTGLHSFAQPFIRYNLGDIAERGPITCPCGFPCATIKKIEGRVLDRILLPEGQLLSPDRLFFVIEREAVWVRQYQLQQLRRDLVRVSLVTDRKPSSHEVNRLQKALQRVVDDALEIKVELVPEIAAGPGGKQRLSHSRVLENYLQRQSSSDGE